GGGDEVENPEKGEEDQSERVLTTFVEHGELLAGGSGFGGTNRAAAWCTEIASHHRCLLSG
ncbi:MAG: hypothetical protein ABIK85_10895, partial [Candidatus Eisenbacteria bacterium]